MSNATSRREFLGSVAVGGAVLASGFMAPWARAAGAVSGPATVVDPNAPAAAAGTLLIGGDLQVSRLGFGAMRITGDGIWGEPRDANEAFAVLRRAVQLGPTSSTPPTPMGPISASGSSARRYIPIRVGC